MKYLLFSFFLTTLLSCQTNSQSVENISAQDVNAYLDSENLILLDVRTAQEISKGIIKNASVIDFYDSNFDKKIQKIQKDKTVIVYCKSGGRSSKAAQQLLAMGQAQVLNLEGGIMSWKKAGFPITKSKISDDTSVNQFSLNDFSELLSTNDLVLVDFQTQWCLPCKKLSPIIDIISADYQQSVYVTKIDSDANENLSNHFKIEAVPTLVLFKHQKEIWRNTGLLSKEDISNTLNQFID
ncbi:MAG: thioredoxin domain-containing protein [Flavobacteriales bacterium]